MLDVFITGQESDRTIVMAGIAATMQSLGYSTGVYKPVQTGAVQKDCYLESPDLVYVKKTDKNIKTYCSYLLKSNDSPNIASIKDNVKITMDTIFEDYQSIHNDFDSFIVSGTNGIATPITNNFLEIDMIKLLDIPVLFVVSPYSSNINDILIMVNHAVIHNVKISGVIISDCPYKTDDKNIINLPKLIEKYTDTHVVGAFPHIENKNTLNPDDLISHVLSGVNLESVFDVKIAKLGL